MQEKAPRELVEYVTDRGKIPFREWLRALKDPVTRARIRVRPEKVMTRTSANYRQGLLQDLADPAEAAAYLNAALEEGSQEAFLMALRDVAEARGMSSVAQRADLNRESMYRMLSKRGNPRLSSLAVLLEEFGLKLTVEIKATAHA